MLRYLIGNHRRGRRSSFAQHEADLSRSCRIGSIQNSPRASTTLSCEKTFWRKRLFLDGFWILEGFYRGGQVLSRAQTGDASRQSRRSQALAVLSGINTSLADVGRRAARSRRYAGNEPAQHRY
jgi:hypothetical protein